MAFLWIPWNILMRMHRRRKKKYITFLYIGGRDDQIATHIKHEFYRIRGELIETIN